MDAYHIALSMLSTLDRVSQTLSSMVLLFSLSIRKQTRKGWLVPAWALIDSGTEIAPRSYVTELCIQSHQSCLTLCDPMDHSPPGSSVHGILQPRTLEWVAISSSRGSSLPREGTHIPHVSCIGRRVVYHWFHLGSPADKKNVLNLSSLPSRWKEGIERKTAGGGEGREKSEVKFFWWEMSIHREPGGSNPHGRRYRKAVQASFFCPKNFFSFFFKSL